MVLFDDGLPRKRLTGQLIWFVLWVLVTGVAAFLKPDPGHHGTHQQLGLPPCPSVLFFHRPCPGCGLTTSWTAFVHGNFTESFRAHALGPLLYLLFTVSACLGMYGWIKGKRLRSDSKTANWALISVLGALLVFGFVRFSTTTYDDPLPALGRVWSSPWAGK